MAADAGNRPRRLDFSHIFSLTLPLAATNQLENLIGFITLYLVGKLGAEAISAVGIAESITVVAGILMVSVITGTMAIVAQGIGEERPQEVSHAIKQSFTWVSIVMLPMGLIGFVLGYDYIGIWASLVIFSLVQGALTTRKYAKGEWKDRVV